MAPKKLLVLALRLAGTFLLLAWPTMVMPVSWQAAGHQMLGMGEFPASPLTDYLTRSIAILYGTRGVVYWLLATDVARFEPLIRLFGWMDILAGVCLLAIGFQAPLPWYWWVFEGPSLIGFGVLILWLLGRMAIQGAEG